MSDWADGLAEAFTAPAVDLAGAWTSGYDLPAGDLAASMSQSVTAAPSFGSILTGITGAAKAVTSLVTARDAYQDARLDRSVNRDIKLMNAQTARDVAGLQAQTERFRALGSLNMARLQSEPSQLGLRNAADDRMILLLTAVGVGIAALQYFKGKK